MVAIEAGIIFLAALDTFAWPEAPAFAQFPQHPYLSNERGRFGAVAGAATLPLMHRAAVEGLKDTLCSLLQKENKYALFFHGPQGVGKSHLLYLAVLRLMAQKKEDDTGRANRVVYIPDCKSWVEFTHIDAWRYFVRSVAIAFATDDEVLHQCHLAYEAGDPHHLAWVFFCSIAAYCKKKKLWIFFAFDQHNSLSNDQRKTFPFSLPEGLLPALGDLRGIGLTVVSASANNEYSLDIARKNTWPVELFSRGFTFEEDNDQCELKVWLRYHNFFPDAPEQLRYWTNYIPYELAEAKRVCAKLPLADQGNLDTVLAQFVKDRTNQMSAQVRKFYSDNERLFLNSMINAMISMSLSKRAHPSSVLVNQQLSVYDSDAQIVRPLTPVCYDVLYHFFREHLKGQYVERMWSALGEMLGNEALDNGTKGRLVEKAFVFGLENNHDALPISAAVCDNTPPKVIFTVPGNAHVIQFSGITPSSANRDASAVFVPNSPSYYGVDFVVWLPTHPKTRLWLLQFTVAPVQQHGTHFFDAKPDFLAAWRELLGVTVDDPIGRVWGCMEIPSAMPLAFRGDYFLLISSLASLSAFRVLQQLRLIQPVKAKAAASAAATSGARKQKK
jgi:hypothetical protein